MNIAPKIGPRSVRTPFRAGERGVFAGAHLRGQRREFVTLINMGEGKVALCRDSDQLDLNINAFEQVQKRRDLRTFDMEAILSDRIDPGLRRFFRDSAWGFARIKTEDLLENFLAIVYKPLTFENMDSLSDTDFFPKK